jgi:Family of unknown function (DUF6496)
MRMGFASIADCAVPGCPDQITGQCVERGEGFVEGDIIMPWKTTVERARRDKRQGKAASTQAGEFIREQMEKIRRGKHGARSPQQAIAIGLSEARRSGVDLPPPKKGRAKQSTRRSAKYAYEAGQGRRKPQRRPRVARAVEKVLKHEPRSAAAPRALSAQSRRAASRRSAASRSAASRKAARTKGAAARRRRAKPPAPAPATAAPGEQLALSHQRLAIC